MRVGSGGGLSGIHPGRVAMGQVRAGDRGASDSSKGQNLPLACWWPASRHDLVCRGKHRKASGS